MNIYFLYFERKSTFRNSMALGQWSNSCQAELLRSTLYVLQSFWFNTNALISLYAMYDIRDYGKEIVCDVNNNSVDNRINRENKEL